MRRGEGRGKNVGYGWRNVGKKISKRSLQYSLSIFEVVH